MDRVRDYRGRGREKLREKERGGWKEWGNKTVSLFPPPSTWTKKMLNDILKCSKESKPNQ